MWEKIEIYIRNMITRLTGINTALPYKPMIGKYKARVMDNKDPLRLGRVVARLKKNGMVTRWATVGSGSLSNFDVPPLNAGVWIEFENFDPSKPIWTGCYYEVDKFGSSNTPALSEKQKIFDSKYTQIKQDDGDQSITLFNKFSEAFVRMLKSGTFENHITGDKIQGVEGKDQAEIIGSWIRSISNEAVMSIGKAFRQSIMGETIIERGDDYYCKQILDSFHHFSGGTDYGSGMRWELTATGYKLKMGTNVPPVAGSMDKIPTPQLDLDFKDLAAGAGSLLLKLFLTNKLELDIDEATKKISLTLFGMTFVIDNTAKTVEFDDKNGFTFKTDGTNKIYEATIHTTKVKIDETGKEVSIVEGVNAHHIKMNDTGLEAHDGKNSHDMKMTSSGIEVIDGVNSGNKYTMGSAGVVIDGTGGGKLELK